MSMNHFKGQARIGQTEPNPLNDPARRNSLRRLVVAAGGGLIARLGLAAPASDAQGSAAPGGARPLLALVILRGGMDGLSAVPATGDPNFAASRGPLAQFDGTPLPLSSLFALNPALAKMHAMYGRGELVVVHATGLPYRERSHFDAQQVLESGGVKPFELATGWLGRSLAAGHPRAIALQTAVPLVLRGDDAVDTWAPSVLPDPSADLVARLTRLYADDPLLGAALARARGLRQDGAMAGMDERSAVGRRAVVDLARKAGEFLAQPNGPTVAVLDIGGWDSHANQAAPQGALSNNLRLLDESLAMLRQTLSDPAARGAWARTVVVVATEFGREVAMNGTQGTDHGSGGAAFVVGGAVAGGRIVADWPGLTVKDRFEGRDLRVTTDLRAVFKGVLGEHLRLPRALLDGAVFPGSSALQPIPGLLRSA